MPGMIERAVRPWSQAGDFADNFLDVTWAIALPHATTEAFGACECAANVNQSGAECARVTASAATLRVKDQPQRKNRCNG
jgi:hypothetical protein